MEEIISRYKIMVIKKIKKKEKLSPYKTTVVGLVLRLSKKLSKLLQDNYSQVVKEDRP